MPNARLWRIDDPTAPGGAVLEGRLSIRPHGTASGITSQGGALYVTDSGTDRCIMADRRFDGSGRGGPGRQLPLRSSRAQLGIVSIGAAPCMIRVARGTTEIEGVELDEGKILFDATFTDAPPVGTHVYSTTDANARPEHFMHGLPRRRHGAAAFDSRTELLRWLDPLSLERGAIRL